MSTAENKLALLKQTLLPGQAHIIRSALEAHDIPCFVTDDHPAGLGIGLGAVNPRIFVFEKDLKKALSILEGLEKNQE